MRYENFLTELEIQEQFEKISGFDINWLFHKTTVSRDIDDVAVIRNNSFREKPMFAHSLIKNDVLGSPHFMELIVPFFSFAKIENINVKQILRAQANLMLPCPTTSHGPTVPHVDYPIDHKVFLYYYNTCDGDTILYDKLYNGESPGTLTPTKSFSPIAGTALNFNGRNYHSATPPLKSEFRIVLNVAYID